MRNTLLLSICFLFVLGCTSKGDELSICPAACDNEAVTDRLDDVEAKVVVNSIFVNDEGDTSAVYAITFNPDDLEGDNWTLNPNFILVPCNLPERFQVQGLNVVISGNRTSCCELLTQPYFRGGYGCRFEITNIRVD